MQVSFSKEFNASSKYQSVLNSAKAVSKVNCFRGNPFMLTLWGKKKKKYQGKLAEEDFKKIIVCLTANIFPIKTTPNRISLIETQTSAIVMALIPICTFVKRGRMWQFEQGTWKYRSVHSNSISVTNCLGDHELVAKCLLQFLHLYNGNDI